jgi:hypothetical protein
VRDGHEDGEVTLGGRRVHVKRPWAGSADGESEVPLRTHDQFGRDQLEEVVLERMFSGISTRNHRPRHDPTADETSGGERSTSKSVVSRRFVHRRYGC